jgi:hypothetical protein
MNPLHRRRFLASSAAALGFPAIIPGRAFGQEAPSKKITVGCIGVGDHGTGRNLNMLLQQPDARVIAVCDVFKTRRARAKQMTDKAYGVPDC